MINFRAYIEKSCRTMLLLSLFSALVPCALADSRPSVDSPSPAVRSLLTMVDPSTAELDGAEAARPELNPETTNLTLLMVLLMLTIGSSVIVISDRRATHKVAGEVLVPHA
jgi:hypothetical protein